MPRKNTTSHGRPGQAAIIDVKALLAELQARADAQGLVDPILETLKERDRLPEIVARLQRFMTALPGLSEPAPDTGPLRLLVRDVGLLATSAIGAGAMGLIAIQGGAWAVAAVPALYFSLAAAGRLRKITVGHMHEAAHGVGFAGHAAKFPRKQVRRLRFWLAETCSVIALSRSAAVYMKKHGKHHALKWLGTIFEPDGEDLAREGFIRPMSPGAFKRALLGKLFNPAWYLTVNARRVAAGLTEGKPLRRISAGLMWATILGSAVVLPSAFWVPAAGLPWLVFYPVASLLQVLTEHPYGDRKGACDLAEYAERTWDRLPWDPVPTGVGGVAVAKAWLRWSARFALLHLPSRLAVLDTMMIWHRYHHMAWLIGRRFDAWWTIAYEARDAWIDGALPGNWQANTLRGLGEALGRQRAHLETEE